MRYFLTLILGMVAIISTYAQNDRFTSVQDVPGKQIYVMPGNIVPCTYVLIDGKLKLVQKDKKHTYTITDRSYMVDTELYQYKKDKYLVLKGAQDIFFLKETDSPLFLSLLKNETIWIDYVRDLNNSYTFLDIEQGRMFHKSSETECYDKLSRLNWVGFTFSENDVNLKADEVTESGLSKSNFVISNTQFKSLKDVAFVHKNNIQPYVTKYEERLAREKREKDIQDSIYNCKLRLATAKKNMTFGGDDDEINVYEGDTIAIFNYNDTISMFIGRYHFNNLRLDENDIKFVDSQNSGTTYNPKWTSVDKSFLMSKKSEGREDRFVIAYDYDTERTHRWLDELRGKIQAYRDKVSYMKKNQIFITKAGYNYDGDQFGMDYDIYNCFGKTIKYVEITLTCYNTVGDVQRDYFGNSTKKVRGIGPIEPNDGGSYSWEKIFWDEYGVIKNCRITAIKFTFKDGTVKSFSGYANIRKHFSGDAWDD